ncbi:GAF domain-containing protein, partial [Methylobacterium platani]
MATPLNTIGGDDSASAIRLSAPVVVDPVRLAALDGLAILDTSPEQGFDDIVRLATRLCAVPVALVSLVTAKRQWFKARVGFPHCETDLNSSVCQYVLSEPDLLVIEDLTADPRTAANPLVTGEPFIRFYAGAPLHAPDGQVLGSLCAIDTQPRPGGLTGEQADDLRALARQVSGLLALRQAVEHRDQALDQREAQLRQAKHIEILAQASHALLTATDPAAVLDPILAASADVLGFDRSYTYDLWPDGKHLRLTHSLNTTPDVQDYLRKMPFGAPVCGIIAERRQPLVLTAMQAGDDPVFTKARALGLNAYVGFPLTSRGALRGVISFASTQLAEFDAEAFSFFETLARMMSAVYERIDSEQALRESDTRSRRAQEAGQVGTFEVDVASGLINVSPEFARIYGRPPTGLYSAEAFESLALPEDRHLVSDDETRAAGTVITDAEYRIRRANDGAVRWIARHASLVRDAAGRVTTMYGTVQDITGRRQAEEHSRESEERFRTIVDTIESAFAIVEVKFDADDRPVDYRFVEANPAFERQAGVNLRGKWVTEFAPDLERFWFETYGHVAKTGEPATFESYAEAFKRWFDVRAVRVGRPGERCIAIFFSDVTARKEAEAALRVSEAVARENVERVQLALAAG